MIFRKIQYPLSLGRWQRIKKAFHHYIESFALTHLVQLTISRKEIMGTWLQVPLDFTAQC